MIREIRYSVSKNGISPAGRQFGGVQGEHKRMRVYFDLPAEIFEEVEALQENGGNGYYRFEVYNGAGEVFRTAPAELYREDASKVCYTLEERDTRYGGIVHVVLSITGMNTEGAEWEMYTFPAELKLKNKPEGVASDGKNRISYSELERKALEASDAALKVKQAYDNGALKGEKGDTGPQGEKGEPGPQGEKGEDGKDAGGDNILHFLTYEIIDREVHITRCNYNISGNRIIPKFIDGYPVVSIDGFDHNDLTSLVIPDSVRSIGEYAFIDDVSFTSVYIPDSVTSIEHSAFAYTSITDVYYGGSEEQWELIGISEDNEPLYNANIYYNQKPATIADVIKHAGNQGYILTDADKQEIANIINASIVDGNEVAY
ncbi:MAG: leucine-rich repeat protein [Clostridia bacterium]|nr:leucine-rich repeat protein [Clostridia bacterium]